ncbi:hypothetical protein P3T76_006099 [Phytophthora citrophthora]|uniref:Uncharacterized protein n=1 Tax=Phytophthora citrophthora TaxID=4793 RepID=A0AAD9GQ51_9STRA|nr:hypothetical protein P3T76_006099 [Phytophthora citrophthora]
MNFMSPEAAALALHSSPVVDGTLLRKLLEAAKERIASENQIKMKYYDDFKEDDLSMEFCRLLSELLTKTDDPKVACDVLEEASQTEEAVVGGLDEESRGR